MLDSRFGVYFKTLREIKGYTLNEVADLIYTSKSTLSRIETGVLKPNEETYVRLMKVYEIECLEKDNPYILDVIKEDMNSFYALDMSRDLKEVDGLEFSNIYFPYNLLAKAIQHVIKANFNQELDQIIKILDKIYGLLIEEYSIMYRVIRSYICIYKKEFILGQKFLLPVFSSGFEDERLKGLAIYYRLSLSNILNNDYESQYLYNEAREIFKKHNLLYRMVKINITEGNKFSKFGMYDEAIKRYQEYFNEIKEDSVKCTVLFNIGNQYLNKKEYSKAIKYYKQSSEISLNNKTLFSIAWCYYNLNDYMHAVEYLEKSNKSNEYTKYFSLLIEWLKYMVKKKYCSQSFDVLKKIEKKYKNTMHSGSLLFVYQQFEDYYQYHEMYKEAYYYSKLINEVNRKY